MKKNFVLIAALVAALAVAFVSCGDDGVVSGTGEKTPAVQFFDTVTTGIIKDTAIVNVEGTNAVFTPDGVIAFTKTGSQYGEGMLFKVTAKVTTKSIVTIKYVARSITGDVKITLKDNSWSTDAQATAAEGGIYQTLKTNEEATLVINAKGFPNTVTATTPTNATFMFQRNDDRNAWLLKILDVKVEEGE
jgi:hypothetical protein